MNLQQLEYFRVVATLEHITKAANVLHIAQPALSKIIKTLERELGLQLFDRVGKNIVLNENGKILLKYARQVEVEIGSAREELARQQLDENRSVTILLKAMPLFVVELVSGFCREHPDICVQMLTYNEQVNQIGLKYDFKIDSSISGKEAGEKNFLILMEEEMVLAVQKGHPLAGREIALEEIGGESFIALPSHSMQEKEIARIFKDAGVNRKVVLESSDYYTIQKMVEAGMGVAFIPQVSFGILRDPGLCSC